MSRVFIERPIATALLAAAMFLAGLLGYRALPVADLPQVEFPTIQVVTQLPGASAQTTETLITSPLERQLGQIAGLTDMFSTSSYGTSTIVLQFILGRDIDAVGEDVQAAINAAGGALPKDLPYPPVYSKVNPADPPIVTLALTSDTVPLREVSDVANTLLGQRLSRVSGVGLVSVAGNQQPAVRVRVDPARMAAYGISLEDLRSVLGEANVDEAKGTIDGTLQARSIGANDQLLSATDYADLVIAYHNGDALRVRDIGTAVDGVENQLTQATANGKPAILVDVRHQPGANILQTVERIRAVLPALEHDIPAGIQVRILSDQTTTIRASVSDVQVTLLISMLLVVLVIFIFLGNVRATLIPSVALPLSLIGTFGVMALCGFSLDNLSLMAMTIGTGFVVDDAIVMIENVVRHIEMGKAPLRAAVDGAGEIGFTILSLTVSLIAVFIPLLFMAGIVGRLFQEFALTLTIAVVMSAIVSLTVTPMMCGHVLKSNKSTQKTRSAWLLGAGERGFGWLAIRYERSLDAVLRHPTAMLIIAFLTLAATIALYAGLPKGFLPREDTGMIAITTRANPDVSMPAMERLQSRMTAIVQTDPAVSGVDSVVGVDGINPAANIGRMTAILKPRGARPPVGIVIARLAARAQSVVGMTIHMQAVQDIQIGARPSAEPFQYTLIDANGRELGAWAPKLQIALAKLPELRDLVSDQEPDGTRLNVTIDRSKASQLGVSMQSVDDTLYDAFGQRQVSTIYGQQTQDRVVLEADSQFQDAAVPLDRLYVKAAAGAMVPLSAIAMISRSTTPLTVTRDGQFPAMTLSFDIASGVSLQEAIVAIHRAEQSIRLPASMAGSFSGDAAEFQVSLASEPWLILAAVVVIYIVLGVLYESTIHPVTILSTLPSAGLGALIALWCAGDDLSLIGLIGIVLLMGIVKKNAIMVIDFALEAERQQGMSPEDAIRRASSLRFRPIMMTTMSALFGAVPLMLGTGAGSELRRPLGIAIVGGLMLSQLLTLYTTPVIYLLLDRLHGLRRNVAGRLAAQE